MAGQEEAEELGLLGRAERHDQHPASRLGHPHQLTQSTLEVREEADAKLGCRDIEGVILQLEGVAVHHPSLDVGESLGARPRVETFDHGRCDVGCQNLRAEASRREAEGAGAGRDVQEPLTRTEAHSAEDILRQGSGQWGCELVVARRDIVPCVAYLFLRGHRLLLRCQRPRRYGGQRTAASGN
jgi:hypothetical protein